MDADHIADGPPRAGKRVYRNIDAPNGSSFYWDQPSVTAACLLSDVGKDNFYRSAAERYAHEFLTHCVAKNGTFLWGNHYFYRPTMSATMRFVSKEQPVPVNLVVETGDLHEMRPLTPDWDFLSKVSPAVTNRAIGSALAGHIYDVHSGGFNRHADGKRGHAFIEAGGILCESAAWLAARSGQENDRLTAIRLANFSFKNRVSQTGLVRNDPTSGRWDEHVTSSEIGLWANCLLRASALLGEPQLSEMADESVVAFASRALEPGTNKLFGMIDVLSGLPVHEGETIYQPSFYSDLWNPLFPRHDYPFALGEACCALAQRSAKSEILNEVVRRLVSQIELTLPIEQRPLYAEHLGRGIRFLIRAARLYDRPEWHKAAQAVADRAIVLLRHGELLSGHSGEARYDAVDGVGLLLIGLLELEHPEIESHLYR